MGLTPGLGVTAEVSRPGKCDTEKIIEVYRYRKKTIDIARKFNTILIPDIVSKQFWFINEEAIFLSKIIEN